MYETVNYLLLNQAMRNLIVGLISHKIYLCFSRHVIILFGKFLNKHMSIYCKTEICIQFYNLYGNATSNIESLAFQPKRWHLEVLDCYSPGSGCSKLTTSLVNVSLKFQTLISDIRQYFCRKIVRKFCSAKASLIFPTKVQGMWL